MNNTIRELISFLVFVFVVHRMRRELDQGNKDATPKKSKIRAVSQRLVAHRTLVSGVHRTVRCGTGQSAQRGRRQTLSGCSTGLSGVHRTVRCANGQTATVGSNGRLLEAPTVG
jgi:hypothetical protein